MKFTTFSYRIKDSSSRNCLIKMADSVNYVWNYCNEVNQERWAKFGKTFTGFDFNYLTTGCAKELGLHSETVQAVGEEFYNACTQFKRAKLNWRNRKRSLGWVPFKTRGIKIEGDTITYRRHKFRVWLSRPFEGTIRCGSFSEDSRGRWYVNLIVEDTREIRPKTGKQVGVDLGLKVFATLSDGVELSRENLIKKYEPAFKAARRANKKRRMTAINTKIKNKRKDWNHKITTALVRTYDYIAIGDVSSSQLIKTRMRESVADASWFAFKTMLARKAIALGVEVKEVKESFSTVTCSTCFKKSGPSGLGGLRVREWVCSRCGSVHERDVNAAKNILHRSLSGTTGQLRESFSSRTKRGCQ